MAFVIVPVLFGLYIIFFNWYAFFKNLKSENRISNIPIVGPLALSIGLYFVFSNSKFICLSFLFDVATLMILVAPIFMLFDRSHSKGASQEEIKKLEELSGVRLPEEYKASLEKMGGGKEIYFDSKMHLSVYELVAYYREEKVQHPKGFILVGWGILHAPYEQLCLNTSDGAIYSACDEVIGEKVFESFEELLSALKLL